MTKRFVPTSMYEHAFRQASTGAVVTALDGCILDANDAACALLGCDRTELLTRELTGLAHPEEREEQRAILRSVASGTLHAARFEQRHRHTVGDDVPVSMTVVLGRDERGRPDCLLVELNTLSPARLAEDHTHRLVTPAVPSSDEYERPQERASVAPSAPLRQALMRHGTIVGSAIAGMVDIVVVVDRSGEIVMMSETAKTLFGELEHEVLPYDWGPEFGVFLRDRVSRCALESYPVMRALRGEIVEQEELWVRLPTWSEGRWHSVTGTPIRDEKGELIGAVSIGRDITQQKVHAEKMQRAAMRDELTGLYNRRGFWAVGEQQLRVAQQHRRSLVLMQVRVASNVRLMDERFTLRERDEHIMEASLILQHCCEESDVVARVGDDKFVLLTENDESTIACVMDRMLACAGDRGHGGENGLMLRFGWARFDPAHPCSLSELTLRAEDEKGAVTERSLRAGNPAGRVSEWRNCPSARPQAFTRRL